MSHGNGPRPTENENDINGPPLGRPVMRFARGAAGAILPPLVIGAALVLGGVAAHFGIGQVMTGPGRDLFLVLLGGPGLLLMLWALFLVSFFRDPERVAGTGLVSPADGRVILVEPVDDPDVGRGHRIAVFMSPADVHVNRVPATATLLDMRHVPGAYLPAFRKESDRNERVITTWQAAGSDGADGARAGERFKLVQIAGAMAKRIVPWTQPGSSHAKGERFGMIKLGSRVDLYLPEGYVSVVRRGDRVLAGATTVARRAS